MKFCSVCEKPLEFLEFLDGDLCSGCAAKARSAAAPEADRSINLDALSDSQLKFDKGKIILVSKEGWTLWSAGANEQTALKTILTRAQRILEIRRKNRKKE